MRLLLSMLCIFIYLNGALLVDMENNQNLEPQDEDVLQNGSTKNKNKDVFSPHSVDKRGSKSEQISEESTRQENKINNNINKIKNSKKNKKFIENRKRYNKVMKSRKKQNKGKKRERGKKGAKGKSKNKVKKRRVENKVKNRRSGKLGRKGKKRALNHCEGPGVPTHFNISLICLNNMVRALKIEKDTVRNFLAQEKRVHSKLKLMGNNANIFFVRKVLEAY